MRKYIVLTIYLLFVVCLAWAGTNNEADSTLTRHQIRIMTYNIKMLPRGAVYIHHHPVIRARLIPDKIIAENPEVVVFEEAFDGKAVRILHKKLKKAYPYWAGQQNRKVVSYKRAGGVLMFSKYPLKVIESIRYTQCKGIDCMGNKGAMLVEVQHPAMKFELLGTHMQAGGSVELKESQYAEAAALLKRHAQEGEPQFAAGDFNTHKGDSVLYPKLCSTLQALDGDITGDLKYTSDHLLNDMEKPNPKKRGVIDYVFYVANGVHFKSAERCVREFEQRWSPEHKDLSDHFAMVLTVKI
ncbi:MAG TPA: endonuclease/exonuclease/phosphatase family protein [Chitinophagales bacterium]|nr:endonuclease/exonuclease/phosphatase family protein [Chitinophagales bacterium]